MKNSEESSSVYILNGIRIPSIINQIIESECKFFSLTKSEMIQYLLVYALEKRKKEITGEEGVSPESFPSNTKKL